MEKKKNNTKLCTIILVIIMITTGVFIWKVYRQQKVGQNQTVNVLTEKRNDSDIQSCMQESKSCSEQCSSSFKNRLIGSGCYKTKNGQADETKFVDNFNLDPANTFIFYENKQFGVSFNVPYNKNWGNKECVVLPFTEASDLAKNSLGVNFGLFRAWTGDLYRFGIKEKRGLEDIKNEKKDSTPNPNLRVEKIGQYQVAVYDSYGMGISRYYEVLGGEKNYVFEAFQIGKKDVNNNFNPSELKNVIETLKTAN